MPVYGQDKVISEFFSANQSWLKKEDPPVDLRHKYKKATLFKTFLERLLSSKMGDWLEQKLKKIQVKRIQAGLPKEHTQANVERVVLHGQSIENNKYHMPPLIKYSDLELQFHPDPTVIEIKRV